MSLTKYASLESAQVIELKGSKDRSKTASLDKLADFHDYRTEDGFLYARIRAISSRVNKNHDGWPSVELAGSQEIFEHHHAANRFTVEASAGNSDYGFATFLGKPVFVDHHNSNPDRARGVIVDAKLHVEDHKTASELDPYYASAPDEHMPPTWVELLLEIDAKSFPKLAQAVVDGYNDSDKGIDGWSMGCDVEKSVCNICKNAASSPDEFCHHVKLKGANFDSYDETGKKTSKKCYEDCYGIKFFEISAVFDPADETALSREVRASVNKESIDLPNYDNWKTNDPSQDRLLGDCPHCGSRVVKDEYYGGVQCEECDWSDGPDPDRGYDDRYSKKAMRGDPLNCPNCGEASVERGGNYNDTEQEVHGIQAGGCPVCNTRPGTRKEIENDTIFGPGSWPPGSRGTDEQPRFAKTAETNPLPQSDLTTAPEEIDTLREDINCEVCGSTMDEEKCSVCGWTREPDGMDNPDLKKNQETDLESDEPLNAEPAPPTELGKPGEGIPTNLGPTSHVRSDVSWKIHVHPKVAGRINPVERPITTSQESATSEPDETTLQDYDTPTTQRTASDMIAAVTKENQMSKQKVAADAPAAGKPDKRVDVEGVGGVIDADNEAASKADAQVDVEGKGGTGVEDVSADRTESVDKVVHTEDSGKTKTFPNKNQADPVGGKTFPTAAKQGTDPVDPVGKADDRVDVEQQVTVNNPQDGTDQWTGTDGNGVTKQQPPVTPKVGPGNDVRSSHIFAALKLADLEVDLGLLDKEKKYDRIAELEQASKEVVEASLKYAQRVRTAGLRRSASTKEGGVGRLPSLGQQAPVQPKQANTSEDDDSLLFT